LSESIECTTTQPAPPSPHPCTVNMLDVSQCSFGSWIGGANFTRPDRIKGRVGSQEARWRGRHWSLGSQREQKAARACASGWHHEGCGIGSVAVRAGSARACASERIGL